MRLFRIWRKRRRIRRLEREVFWFGEARIPLREAREALAAEGENG